MPQQRQFRIQLTFSFPPAEITLLECIMIPLGFQCPAPSYPQTPSQGHKNRIPSAICRTEMRSVSLMKNSKRKNLETEVSRFLELLGGFEPPTSSLPRMRSTYWATAAYWRPRRGSNPRPPAWQAGVLTNWTTRPNFKLIRSHRSELYYYTKLPSDCQHLFRIFCVFVVWIVNLFGEMFCQEMLQF